MTLPAAAGSRRTRGGAGGVRPNRAARRSEQKIWVPEALYRGPYFSDDAITIYTKVAALDARKERCNASVQNLADYCGLSKSGAERGLRQLNAPGPGGDLPWLGTTRRTHHGGRGRTALRYARLVPYEQGALRVPVAAGEALAPRLYRAYLHLRRAAEQGIPVTAAELAKELFHHTGKNAGQPLNERTGRRIMNELDRAGWITLDHRAGYQGRHLVTVNDTPLRAVPALAEPAAADSHDGSGADDHGGSLALEEDSNCSPDVGAMAGGGIRRRRTTGSRDVDTWGNPVRPAAGRGYTGPGLQLSPRVCGVLTPVRHLLPGIRTYVLREIAREIGAQLDAGTPQARLAHRLTHRYGCTEDVRNPGGWILGPGLVRRGCGLTACESGVIWDTGERCQVCAEPAVPPEGAAAAAAPRAWHECTGCQTPSRTPLTAGLCRACRNPNACRWCHQPVLWTTTRNPGAPALALDAAPNPHGEHAVRTLTDGRLVSRPHDPRTAPLDPGEALHRPHALTCRRRAPNPRCGAPHCPDCRPHAAPAA